MEHTDPMGELLSSLEHIMLTREVLQAAPAPKAEVSIAEPKRIREITGMDVDEFARACGVSASSVKSWEASRSKPSRSAQKLLQLIQSNPCLSRQLLGC